MIAGKRFSALNLRLVSTCLLVAMTGILGISTPVLAAPVLSVSPASGAVGTEVTITGSVFDSYKGDIIQVTFDGVEIPEWSPFEIPDSGSFEIPYTIPAGTEPGSYIIRVDGAVGSTQFFAETVFRVEASTVVLDLTEGPVGTSVTVTGRGFYSDAPVNINYHNPAADLMGTVTTTSTGRFTYSFLIPASTGGSHTISASNSEGNTAEAEFTVTSSISLNKDSGGPGDVINITGAGYGFRSTVTLSIDSVSIASGKSGDFGGFTLNFNVPDKASGPYDLRVSDSKGNIALISFTITAGASLSQTSGAVGSELTVTGSGFISLSSANVDFAMLRIATVTTDNKGGFTFTFSVPAVGAGTHTVSISDGTTTRQILYTIEDSPPLAPARLLPADGGQTKVNAYLDWEDVTDDSSPVIYHLQVASDPGFTTLIVDRDDLEKSEYSLGVTENLTMGTAPISYYWRVKAEDAAWNESEWSASWSFIVAPPAAPVIVLAAPQIDTTPSGIDVAGTEDGEEETVTAEEEIVELSWESVTSISEPVTYIVEISDDPDFENPVLVKSQLTSAGYLLTDEDLLALKNNVPYFWRVKAVDNDRIESSWSEAASFTIDAPSFKWPAWATFLLIGLAVIGVVFLAFRIGRRTAYNQYD